MAVNTARFDRFNGLKLDVPPLSLPPNKTDDMLNGYTIDGKQFRKRPGIGQGTNEWFYFPNFTGGTGVPPMPIWDMEFFGGGGGAFYIMVLIDVVGAANNNVVPAILDYVTASSIAVNADGTWRTRIALVNDAVNLADRFRLSRIVMGHTGMYRTNPQAAADSTTTPGVDTDVFRLERLGTALNPTEIKSPGTVDRRRQQEAEYHRQRIFASLIETPGLVIPLAQYAFTDFDSLTSWPTRNNNFTNPQGETNRNLGFKSMGDILYIGTTQDLWALTGSTLLSFHQQRVQSPAGCVLGRSAIDAGGILMAPAVSEKTTATQDRIFNILGISGFRAELIGDEIAPMITGPANTGPRPDPRNGIGYFPLGSGMFGAYWKEEGLAIWFLRRDGGVGLTRDADNLAIQVWLVRQSRDGSFWKWQSHQSLGVNCIKAIDGKIVLGCQDGNIRYFSHERAFDYVIGVNAGQTALVRTRRAFRSFFKTAPVARHDGGHISLEWVEVEGHPGTEDPNATNLLDNDFPGPEAWIYARSDRETRKLVGKVLLDSFAKRVLVAGKINAGRTLEVWVEHATDRVEPELHAVTLGIEGLGQNIPKEPRV